MLEKDKNKIKIPKLQFRPMTLEENIEIIKWAYYEDNGVLSVHDFTTNYFPELKEMDEDASKEDVYNLIEQVVTKNYENYKTRMIDEATRYNNLWKEYNDIYFKTLSKYLEISWPSNLDIIEATVGLIPVFPRYLDSFSFSVSTGIDDTKLIETCAHETLHFLWFEKWKKIHPEIPRREYDSPYLTWQYSEMVTDPILNNKPFSDIFNFVEYGYDSFYEIYDNDILVMDKLRKIYSENISIEEKIDKGFTYVQKVLKPNNDMVK